LKFSEINEDAWRDHKTDFSPSDTAKAFRAAWKDVPFDVLTARNPGDLDLHHPKVAVEKPTLSWPKGLFNAATTLGFDPKTEVAEVYAINLARKELDDTKPISFKEFLHATKNVWQEAQRDDNGPALRVYTRASVMSSLKVWEDGTAPGSVGARMRALFDDKKPRRVVSIDLASLDMPEQRSIVANRALDALWIQRVKPGSKRSN